MNDILAAAGLPGRVRILDRPAPTAVAAAEQLGCPVGAIANSLVFATADDEPVLIMTSGAHRVDLARVRNDYGLDLRRASADFVRTHTSQPIGGVAPVGHPAPIRTLVDRDLAAYDPVGGRRHPARGVPADLRRPGPADRRHRGVSSAPEHEGSIDAPSDDGTREARGCSELSDRVLVELGEVGVGDSDGHEVGRHPRTDHLIGDPAQLVQGGGRGDRHGHDDPGRLEPPDRGDRREHGGPGGQPVVDQHHVRAGQRRSVRVGNA